MRAASDRASRGVVLAVVASALALTLAGLPWVLGSGAQGAYQKLINDLLGALPPGSILTDHYERGWFRSQATTELALGNAVGQPRRIRIDSQLDQGPFHWLSSGLPPALVRVHSRVELSDPPGAPILVVTDLGADGRSRSRIRWAPPLWPGPEGSPRLSAGELTGNLRFEPSSGALDLDLALPEAELEGHQRSLARVLDLRLTSSLRQSPAGDTRVGLGPLTGSPGAVESTPGTLGSDPGPAQRPSDGRLDLHLGFSAEALTLDGQTYRQPRLGLTTTDLDRTVLGDLKSVLQVLSPGGAPLAMRQMIGAALLGQLLPRLAAGHPRILVDPARIDTPEGPVTARLSLEIEPLDQGIQSRGARRADASGLIRALRAEGEIDLPEPLARRWLAPPSAGPGRPGSAPSSGLQGWLDDGLVSLREGRVTSTFRLADGLFTVNGRTFPLLDSPSANRL